jgi:hypothetical protein
MTSNLFSIFKRMNVHSGLALAGAAGPLVLAVTDITAAITNPSYSLVRDSISSLALTSIGWLQTIGFLAIGLLVEIYVAGLLFNVKGVRGFRVSIGMLVFFGFGLLLIGAFRTDPVGGPDTIDGTIHSVVATGAFWLFPIAAFVIAPSLRRDPNWRNIYVYTLVAGALGIGLVLWLGFLPDESGYFGLLERLLVANMIAWVEVTAIKLLRLSVRERA